jgi:hypothetical protein
MVGVIPDEGYYCRYYPSYGPFTTGNIWVGLHYDVANASQHVMVSQCDVSE